MNDTGLAVSLVLSILMAVVALVGGLIAPDARSIPGRFPGAHDVRQVPHAIYSEPRSFP